MHADLDTLCTAVHCTADDLLPEKPENACRRVTDAVVATLCVAQVIRDIPSDRRLLAVVRGRLCHLLPELPRQPGFTKRRARLTETIDWVDRRLHRRIHGYDDDLLLIDSTPVECARSVETTRRSRLADAADYGSCAPHSRFFWGFRLHCLFAPTGRRGPSPWPRPTRRARGRPRAARAGRAGGRRDLIGDKGSAGCRFAAAVAELDATIVRPARRDEPDSTIHLGPIHRRIESIFWSRKDILTPERHGACTLNNLRVRIAQRFPTLAACVALNPNPGDRAGPWSITSPGGVESIIWARDQVTKRRPGKSVGHLLAPERDIGQCRGAMARKSSRKESAETTERLAALPEGLNPIDQTTRRKTN